MSLPDDAGNPVRGAGEAKSRTRFGARRQFTYYM